MIDKHGRPGMFLDAVALDLIKKKESRINRKRNFGIVTANPFCTWDTKLYYPMKCYIHVRISFNLLMTAESKSKDCTVFL